MNVVERLIESVVGLDYPRDRLQIQVLDDSTDETTALVQALVSRYQSQGVDIDLYHRELRTGYKAGALAQGLKSAKGDYIAVFDADFAPPPDWLQQTLSPMLNDPGLGFVQTRWGHINATYSLLTMAEAIILDTHFGIEHPARQRSGYFMNFNGTAGIWRRSCIEEVGSWLADTLTEDLDLSYRAQLAGWRSLFLTDIVAPAEVPPQLAAFKNQQFRWAKGSAQCLRRLARPIWQSRFPLITRVQGLIHLSGYFTHPLMLVILLLSLPLVWWGWPTRLPLAYLSFASLGPPLIFTASQFVLYARKPDGMPWWRRITYVPLVLLIGAGIAPNNAHAIIEGLLDRASEFKRTPKFHVERRQDGWADKRYTLGWTSDALVDLFFTLYALLVMAAAWYRQDWWALPFLGMYAGGFGLMCLIAWWQNRQRQTPLKPTRSSAWVPPAGHPSLH